MRRSARAASVVRDAFGDDAFEPLDRPMMGSEDFAFMLEKVRGAYLFIGNGDSAGLHSSRYDFNDALLERGPAFLHATARRFFALILPDQGHQLVGRPGFSDPWEGQLDAAPVGFRVGVGHGIDGKGDVVAQVSWAKRAVDSTPRLVAMPQMTTPVTPRSRRRPSRPVLVKAPRFSW